MRRYTINHANRVSQVNVVVITLLFLTVGAGGAYWGFSSSNTALLAGAGVLLALGLLGVMAFPKMFATHKTVIDGAGITETAPSAATRIHWSELRQVYIAYGTVVDQRGSGAVRTQAWLTFYPTVPLEEFELRYPQLERYRHKNHYRLLMQSAETVDVDALHEALVDFTGGLCSSPVNLPLEIRSNEEFEEDNPDEESDDDAESAQNRSTPDYLNGDYFGQGDTGNK